MSPPDAAPPPNNGGRAHQPGPIGTTPNGTPNLPADINNYDTCSAALALAQGGLYVFPTKAKETYNPATGGKLQFTEKATRDPRQIIEWFAGSSEGDLQVAVSCGHSGLVVVDEDRPGILPTESFTATLVSITSVGRCQHWYRVPPGRKLGNSTGTLPKGFGEIRAGDAYVVAPTSTHHRTGDRYHFADPTVPVAVLPKAIADKLPDAGDTANAVDDETIKRFVADHAEGDRLGLLEHVINKAARNVDEGASRHDSLVSAAAWAMREALAGAYPALEAIAQLRGWFTDVLATGPNPRPPAHREFAGVMSWAIGQALATGEEEARRRLDPPENDPRNLIDASDRARSFLRTDVGNAQRLVSDHGHRFRYVSQWATWVRYDGQRWQRDTALQIVEAAKVTTRAMIHEAFDMPDSDDRPKAIKWALGSESAARIDAMIRLARSVCGVPVAPDELDADNMLLNVANGTINLRTGHLRDHDPADLCTKLADVNYHPDAAAPRWQSFLETILPDADVREFVARTVGYALTGDVSEQKLFIFFGSGANGKTTLCETVDGVMGDYASQAEPDLLVARQDAHPTGIARLQGVRLALSSESDDGRRLAEGVVKRLTGGDKVTARFMRADFFEYDPTAKFFLLTNHKPRVRGTDHAIWRRLMLVPFAVTIAPEDQDPHLPRALAGEAEGILAWAVQACLRWRASGLTDPLAVQLATHGYRAQNDVMGEFLADVCDFTEPDVMTSSADLYAAYTVWCSDNGEKPSSQRRLGLALTERGLDRVKHGPKRRWHWIGLQLTAIDILNL